MTSFFWRNKVAVITGASQGIGAAIAVELANAGVVVIGLSRRPEVIQDLNENVTGEGKIYSRYCDLTKENSIIESFKWIREKFYVIHILICNAGILKSQMLIDSSTDELKEVFDLNVIATSICLREGLQHMRDTKTRSHIILINSILGHRIPIVPIPMFNIYPASKHAITAICQTTRQEIQFLELNIKLTSISPGMVDTDMLKVYNQQVMAALPKLQPADVAKAVYYALSTPEHCEIEDIILNAKMVKANIA